MNESQPIALTPFVEFEKRMQARTPRQVRAMRLAAIARRRAARGDRRSQRNHRRRVVAEMLQWIGEAA